MANPVITSNDLVAGFKGRTTSAKAATATLFVALAGYPSWGT